MKSPLILRVFKGAKLFEVKQFDIEQIIVGNGGEVQLNLEDEKVAPIHCLIELRDSGYYLCDLGSATGTFKNGKQILDEAISSGDQIGVGAFTIHFFVGVPKPKAPPVAEKPTTVAAPITSMANAADTVVKPESSFTSTKPKAPVYIADMPVEPALPKTPVAPVLPEVAKQEPKDKGAYVKKKRNKNFHVFAPKSEFQSLKDYLQPTKGQTLQVIVAWQERVLNTYHFSSLNKITIGSSEKANVHVPPYFLSGEFLFIERVGPSCKVNINSSFQSELIVNEGIVNYEQLVSASKVTKTGTGSAVRLDQGEVLSLGLDNNNLQIFVRFVQSPPIAPLADGDLSTSGLTALVVSLVFVSLFALYMSVYNSAPVVEEKQEEQIRLAQFVYDKKEVPTPTPTPTPEPVKEKKVEVKATPTPMPTVVPKKVEVAVKDPNKKDQKDPGSKKESLAAEVRANPNKLDRPKKFTSTKEGGAAKVGDTEGANAQSNKDVTKTGLLSAFGGGGNRAQLDQAYSGTGELLGMADKATGTSGQKDNRAGNDLGSKFKDTGAGGKGTATQGIAGIGTKGKSSGQSAYGDVGSLGGKGKIDIDVGGLGEEFTGTVDREAVRRVVRSILGQIKSCYERQLRQSSEIEGKIVIHWSVYEQGRVKSSSVKSAEGNMKSVAECVAARIREQRFPEPPGGSYYEVDYPFVFGAQN